MTQPGRKQQTNEWQSTQLSMRPTTLTGPLTHRPETQNKARPGSEHPPRHRAAPKANRPTGRNPNTQPAPPFHMRPNGETTTIGDHRGSKQDREDHLTQKMRHAPAPTPRSAGTSPDPDHRQSNHNHPPPHHGVNTHNPRRHTRTTQTSLIPKRADAGLQTANIWQTPCQVGASPAGISTGPHL